MKPMLAVFRRSLVGTILTVVFLTGTDYYSPAGNFYPGVSPENVPWPGGEVPYEFAANLSAAERQTYLDGLREWELVANVKFVPHAGETRWILFTYDPNGLNSVSSGYDPQVVSVTSLSRGQVCHEMGHSFGFTHENIRLDRNNYIMVLTNNISDPEENLSWFTVDEGSVPHGPYDFESVMHLGWDFASVQPGVVATQEPQAPYWPRYRFRMGNYCISPGDRAAMRYLYGDPVVPLTNVVTTTADTGPGSLRAALYYVADNPGSAVHFDIPTSDPGFSNDVFTIYPSGFLPPFARDGMVLNGTTQPGYSDRPLIVIDGSRILEQTFTAHTGLLIYSAGNEVRGISARNFDWNGITLQSADATNNIIAGCWLGLDDTGAGAAGNHLQGILIWQGASRNIIGGTNALDRNVLSGNKQYGIFITDPGTSGNVLLGNYVGTDPEGVLAVPNESGGAILVNGASSNLVGGVEPSSGNIISGNTNFGLWIGDPGTTGNIVRGNFVGLAANGVEPLPNTFAGMYLLDGTRGNTVSGNVISGQPAEGLRIQGLGTSYNVVQGNYFGTDSTGTSALPNGFAGLTIFGGATSNLIGGTIASDRNVISGNSTYGVVIGDPGTSDNDVIGNGIGVDETGTGALPNGFANVALWNGTSANNIGGADAGEGNLIAHSWLGVVLYDNATTNNSIRGNAVFGHGSLGIDLGGDGVTTNHVGEVSGPNSLQNYPVLTSVSVSGSMTTVSGTLNSVPNRSFWIDIYGNVVLHPSGHGEGQSYLGSAVATTAASGSGSFSLAISGDLSGQFFSVTATDQATGDTSEFSLALQAVASVSAPVFSGPLSLTSTGFLAQVTLSLGQSYRIQAATNLTAGQVEWIDLTNFNATHTPFIFLDRFATNFQRRFYRVVSP